MFENTVWLDKSDVYLSANGDVFNPLFLWLRCFRVETILVFVCQFLANVIFVISGGSVFFVRCRRYDVILYLFLEVYLDVYTVSNYDISIEVADEECSKIPYVGKLCCSPSL